MGTFEVVAALVAIVVIAAALGAFVASYVRLPEVAWKVSLIVGALGVSALILATGWPPKQGIDLKGGAILIYEVNEELTKQTARSARSAEGENPELGSESVDMPGLIHGLSQRINPGGVQEIVVRRYGDKQVEVIIPDVTSQEIERVKKLITTGGFLKFMIVANARDHGDIWRLADEPSQVGQYEVRDETGKTVGQWVKLAIKTPAKDGKEVVYREDPAQGKSRVVRGRKEILMVVDDNLALQGSHLQNVRKGFDGLKPAVFFDMTTTGAQIMGTLTQDNLPDQTSGHFSLLGIVMDNELISAPQIKSRITSSGYIQGDFTDEEVELLASVLRAGRLPAVLNEEPISQDAISPLLGNDTIRQGKAAITTSLVVVMAFMLIYYRFCGLVSCIALILNLTFTLALMIFIGAAFSLPGMAGMVLTVGMSVDASVLVFERIREELRNGAAVRMAIRNGFGRATNTIVDSNLTTLITALVLYWIGNEQLKSFAVTLILGILMCIFTAVFCSRVVFDVAEKAWRMKSLTMMQFFKDLRVDYFSIAKPAIALSLLVIGIGLAAVFARGRQIFDIDFLGGTSIQMLLKDPMDIAQVRERVDKLRAEDVVQDVAVTEVVSKEHGAGRIYRIDTSLPPDAEGAEAIARVEAGLIKHFADGSGTLLQTHSLRYTAPTAIGLAATGAAETGAAETPSASASSTDASGAGSAEINSGQTGEFPSGAQDAGAQDAPVSGESQPAGSDASQPAADANEPAAPATGDQSWNTPLPSDHVLAYGGPILLAQATPGQPAATATDSSPADAASSQAVADALQKAIESSSVTVDAGRLRSESKLSFDERLNAETLEEMVKSTAKELKYIEPDVVLTNPQWDGQSSQGFNEWTLQLSNTPEDAERILSTLKTNLDSEPVWLSANQIGSSVAGNKTRMAFVAVGFSFLAIIGYIWIRFEKVIYGIAAVVALVHDVLVTLGAIALSYYLKDAFGFLMVDEFKISMPVLAAILTIIGYSLNDTIVIFDRIREIKGKSPRLTEAMVNSAVNQTMSRTILTALTTLMSVVVLYIWGGQGVHAFAFALLIGVVAGTYSTIYIASPLVLWINPSSVEPRKVAEKVTV